MIPVVQSDKPVMIILADNTALYFHATKPRGGVDTNIAEPSTPIARVGAFLKSFLPTVSVVTPIDTKLPTGRRIHLHSPAAAF